MNIINTKQETYITLAPSLTGLISHYKYGTLYNIYTITNRTTIVRLSYDGVRFTYDLTDISDAS